MKKQLNETDKLLKDLKTKIPKDIDEMFLRMIIDINYRLSNLEELLTKDTNNTSNKENK